MPEGTRRIGAEVFVAATQAKSELDSVSGKVRGISAAAEETSSKASAAMNGFVSSSRAGSAALGTQSAAARGASVSMAQLEQIYKNVVAAQGANSTAAQTLAAELQVQGRATQGAAAAAGENAAAQQRATVAQTELTGATVAGGEAATFTTRQMVQVGAAVDRMAGAAVPGARAIGLLAGSFSAAALPQLALIIGVSLLIGELLKLARAKDVLFKADEEQIRVDAVQATLTGDRIRLNADVVASFALISKEQEAYQQNTQDLTKALDDLKTKGEQTSVTIMGDGLMLRTVDKDTKALEKSIGGLTQSLADQDKAMRPAIDSLTSIRNLYGLNTEALIGLAQQLGFANKGTEDDAKALQFLREQLDADLPSLRALASELGKTTDMMGDMERQALRTGIAVREIKPPKLDLDFLRSQVTDFNAEIQRAIAAAQGGFNGVGPADPTKMEAAIRPTLESIRTQLRRNAAEMSNSAEETKRNYEVLVNQLNPEYQRMILNLDQVDKNMKAFADHTKQQEAAVKSLAKATAELNAELEKAQAVEGGKTFDAQIKEVQAAMQKKHDLLLADHHLTEQNELTLTALTLASITKINNEHVKAREEAEQRIAAINAKATVDEYDRHKQAIETQTAEDHKFFVSLGLDEVEVYALTIQARKGREEEFARWKAEHDQKERNKEVVAWRHIQEQMTAIVEEEQLKRDQLILKSARDQANARIVAGKFLLSQGQGASSREIDQFLGQLKKLGPAFQDVDKNADQAKTAIDYVRNAFGFASQSAEMFQLKLDLLTGNSITFGQTFNAIVSEMFTTVQGLTAIFDGIGQAVSSVFEGIITGTQSAKAAFLNFLATILMQMGQMAIAIGTIMLFLPGYGGLGVGLIAAGIAAMALAGVFRGLASNASQAHNAATGGAASGSAATGSTSPAVRPQPQVIDLSSATRPRSDFSGGGLAGSNFAQSQRPLYVTLQLDRNVSNDLINGKRVLTRSNIKDEHFQAVAAVVKKVKK